MSLEHIFANLFFKSTPLQVLAALPCRGPSRPTSFFFACDQRDRVEANTGTGFVDEVRFSNHMSSTRLTSQLVVVYTDACTFTTQVLACFVSETKTKCAI